MKKAIFASAHKYNSNFKLGDHHYAKLLSENGYEILWLDPPTNYIYSFKDDGNYREDYNLSKSNPEKVDNNIFEYCPFTFLPYMKVPPLNSFFVGKNSIKMCNNNFKKYVLDNGYRECDILWISNPKYAFIDEFVKSKCIIHRMGDDFAKFKGLPNTFMKMEFELIRKSDLYYVTAVNLLNKYSHIMEPKYLPNGCAYDHFQRSEYSIPIEYVEYKDYKKVIYVGAIDTWFDIELVRFSVERNRNVHFFIIGPSRIDMETLKSYSNVHILGAKSYNEIPNYIYFADLGIIPFQINDLIRSVNPIKMFEYSACGVPTIVTPMEEVDYMLKNYSDIPIYIASTKLEFSNYIKNIEKTEENSKILKKFAKENSWNKRLETILNDIESIDI